jgi:2-hydroxychromene-2-carboxylate isomerase
MAEIRPYAFSAAFTVCLDVTNPASLLAVPGVRELEAELGVDVRWLPYLVPPAPARSEPGPEADRGKWHRWHRARYRERDLRRYASLRGIDLGDLNRQTSGELAALALLWVQDQPVSVGRALLDGLLEGHWSGALDIEEPESVTALLVRGGARVAGWEDYRSGRGPIELAGLRSALSAAGVFDVPALVVAHAVPEPEVLLGRAHLPMVRWLLTDRHGPPPI